MPRQYTRRPLVDRFWEKVKKSDGCWEWQGSTAGSGYGQLKVPGASRIGAHRFSWELHYGPIPPGLFVCHHCDNRTCVRPDHLFLGTSAENNADAARKGRFPKGKESYPGKHPERYFRGQDNPNARLTDAAVRDIRRRCAAGESQRSLAREYGVDQTLISLVVLRKAWRHIE